MRYLRPASLLVWSLIPALIAAQQPRRDTQALAILAQSYAVMAPQGGGVQDALLAGNIVRADGTTGSMTIKSKGVDRLRHEISLGGRQFVYVLNGGRGYALRGGTRHGLPLWVTAYQRSEHIPPFSRLIDFLRPNMNVVYVGLEDVGGRQAHHIRLSALPTDGTPARIEELISEFHVFVDAQSMLVVKTQSFLFSPAAIENRSPVDTYYSEYRSVAGLLVPYRVTRYVSRQRESDITLTSVQLNVGLSDSEFQ